MQDGAGYCSVGFASAFVDMVKSVISPGRNRDMLRKKPGKMSIRLI